MSLLTDVVLCYVVVLCLRLHRLQLCYLFCFFFFQAEDGIRDLVRSRGLGDVYKRQGVADQRVHQDRRERDHQQEGRAAARVTTVEAADLCLLYTSDAADERSSVDLGGRRII